MTSPRELEHTSASTELEYIFHVQEFDLLARPCKGSLNRIRWRPGQPMAPEIGEHYLHYLRREVVR